MSPCVQLRRFFVSEDGMKRTDCLIVGGGASGLTAAISAKRAAPAMQVTLLEGGPRVGKKLLTTGNGRCNLTNAKITLSRYRGGDLAAAERVLSRFDPRATAAFFASLGVPLREEGDQGKLYPYSLQAASVVDVLRFECDRLGVETLVEQKAERLTETGVVTADETYRADRIVIACGGQAAPRTGSDGSGYALLKQAGHTVTPVTPAIVPIRTETEPIRAVKGLKVDGVVTASARGESRREAGEILFTEYGLSGPPILQLSGLVAAMGGAELTLDLLPEKSEDWLVSYLRERKKTAYGDVAENLFLGLMHKRVGIAVLKRCGVGPNDSAASLGENALRAVARMTKAFRLKATGVCGWDAAQVTAGGVPLSEFDDSLMSRRRPGLFACGEVLDVTGDCGGFNLQWAWSSGYVAGRSAAAFERSRG